ncbi:MAG TPA: SUMF1/EgtB/PvdO family nonheme iron enzyme [Opitutaceae bacterium]|nr:SUMF1/EgtB/PvdO family nonheme iron enzyme [Opitutaceae bacterium]
MNFFSLGGERWRIGFGAIILWLGGLGQCPVSADEAAPQTGSVIVYCVPLAGQVSIAGLAPEGAAAKGRWEFRDLAAGSHSATITAANRTVTHAFDVIAGQTVQFTVNLFQGKVQEGAPAAKPALASEPARSSPPPSPPVAAAAAKAAPATKAANLLKGSRFDIPDLGVTMIAVEPGTLKMGGSANRGEPLTDVTLTRRYWLGRTEITQAQWRILWEHNNSLHQGADLPLECVSWQEAMQFCQRLTKREREAGRIPENYYYMLPSEAQWEYACRAGAETEAGDLEATDWYDKNSGGETHPVGQKQPNAWGFCDMRGNVSEWCFDWFGAYRGGALSDPLGPAEGERHALRGGTFNFGAFACTSTRRGSEVPGNSHPNVGFRLALIFVPPAKP